MRNNLINIIFLITLYFAFFYFHFKVLDLDNLYFKETQELKIPILKNSNNFYSYNLIFIGITIVLKIFIVTIIINIGALYYDIKLKFKDILYKIILGEYIFLFSILVEIIYFKYLFTNASLNDIQYFYPLSALNIIGHKGLEAWFIYPLQVLNLFELAYWLLLSYFVGKLAFTEKDKGKPIDLGFKIVASSYGSALLLWVVVVMFFTLNYS